jgi:hypothetical protein
LKGFLKTTEEIHTAATAPVRALRSNVRGICHLRDSSAVWRICCIASLLLCGGGHYREGLRVSSFKTDGSINGDKEGPYGARSLELKVKTDEDGCTLWPSIMVRVVCRAHTDFCPDDIRKSCHAQIIYKCRAIMGLNIEHMPLKERARGCTSPRGAQQYHNWMYVGVRHPC